MAECPICRNHFFLLEDDAHCQKCKATTPGLSKSEIVVINVTINFSEFIGLDFNRSDCQDKPQCAACGIISANLKNLLCNLSIEHYRKISIIYHILIIANL